MNNDIKGYTLIELLIALFVLSIGVLSVIGLWSQILNFDKHYKTAGTLYNLLEYSGSLIWNLQSDNGPEAISQNLDQRLSNVASDFFQGDAQKISVSYSNIEIFEVSPNLDGYVRIPPSLTGYTPVIAELTLHIDYDEKVDINSPIILGP